MADIAVVFHWQPDVMENWAISELADWRERARKRSEAED